MKIKKSKLTCGFYRTLTCGFYRTFKLRFYGLLLNECNDHRYWLFVPVMPLYLK